MILDAMAQALREGRAHRDPRVRQLRPELPAAAHRAQSEVGREGAGAGEVRAALQGRQGAARARRRQERPSTARGRARASAPSQRAVPLRRAAPDTARVAHAYRHLDDPRLSSFLLLRRVRARRTPTRSRCASTSTSRWQAPLVVVLLGVLRRRARCSACSALLGTRDPRSGARSPRCSATPQHASRARRSGPPPTAPRPRAPLTSRWNSSSGGCSASRCSSPWAGSPRASTSSTCCTESRALPLSYFRGPQLPAERAARQGDRGVHRGRQGRSADRRAALRARQPVPPPRRVRPRDPHAPEPARARRPARRAEARPRSSSSARTTSRRASSTAPRRCS